MVLYKRNCIVASSIKLRGDQLLADLSRVLVGKRIVSVTGSCFAGGRSFRPNCRECLSESGYTQDKDSPVRFSSSDGSVKPPKNASRCKTVVAGDTNKKTLDFEIDDGTKLSLFSDKVAVQKIHSHLRWSLILVLPKKLLVLWILKPNPGQ